MLKDLFKDIYTIISLRSLEMKQDRKFRGIIFSLHRTVEKFRDYNIT